MFIIVVLLQCSGVLLQCFSSAYAVLLCAFKPNSFSSHEIEFGHFSPFREDESFRFDRLPDVELDIRAPFKLKGKSDDFDIKADDIFF